MLVSSSKVYKKKGEIMNKKSNETKIIVLGGLGEVGKNMYCVMHEDELLL